MPMPASQLRASCYDRHWDFHIVDALKPALGGPCDPRSRATSCFAGYARSMPCSAAAYPAPS